MSQFIPKKLNIEAIHAGQRYPDAMTPFLPSDVNEIIDGLYGASVALEKTAKRAFLLTSSSSLIDISVTNKRIFFPLNTKFIADGYYYNLVNDTYISIGEDIMLLKQGVVIFNHKTKSITIVDDYNSGTQYEYLYLFSFNFEGDKIVDDLPIPHLLNGVSNEGTGGGSGASVEIVQTTGDSTTAVMSQAAVTQEVDAIVEELSVINDELAEKLDEETANELYVKQVKTPGEPRAYTIDANGNQTVTTVDIDSTDAYSIAGRTSTGTVRVGTPKHDSDAVPLKYADEHYIPLIANTTGQEEVPLIMPDNSVVRRAVSMNALPYRLVMRDDFSNAKFGTPQHDQHAVPLGYANEHYAQLPDDTITTNAVLFYDGNTGKVIWQYARSGTPANTIVIRDGFGRSKFTTPKSSEDAANKEYVDDDNARIKYVYWSDVNENGEVIVTNGEYCIAFCDEAGDGTDILSAEGNLRFEGYFDEVLIRGEGYRDVVEYENQYDAGVSIFFNDNNLAHSYKIIKFRELPCPTGAVVLIIEVIY